MEWQRWQAQLCSGCGLPRDECMAPEGQAPDYEAHRIVCWACAERDRESRAFRAEFPNAGGVFFSVAPKRDPEVSDG